MVYSPSNVPGTPEQLVPFLRRELTSIARAIINDGMVTLTTLHVEPTRPQEGMIVLADGTDWDPGSGAGFYGYRGAAWRKLD